VTRAGRVALLLVGCLAVSTCAIREDELECESAMAHLAKCCPGFNPMQFSCRFEEGCDQPEIVPRFDVPTSQCIRALGCEQVQANGLCDPHTGGGCGQ
jgi:hypothetical protein